MYFPLTCSVGPLLIAFNKSLSSLYLPQHDCLAHLPVDCETDDLDIFSDECVVAGMDVLRQCQATVEMEWCKLCGEDSVLRKV